MMARYNKAKSAALKRGDCPPLLRAFPHEDERMFRAVSMGAVANSLSGSNGLNGQPQPTGGHFLDWSAGEDRLQKAPALYASANALDTLLGPKASFSSFQGKESREKPLVHSSARARPTQQSRPSSATEKTSRLSSPVADWSALLCKLPTGLGPATTARRNQIWRAIAGMGGGSLGVGEVDHGLRAVLQLEQGFPHGIGPLLARAMQVAFGVARPYSSVPSGIERGEAFRLVLVGFRGYLELYAILTHRIACSLLRPSDLDGVQLRPGKPISPVVVTREEYIWLMPMLKRWGAAPADPASEFSSFDTSHSGIIKFDELARSVLPAMLRHAAMEGTGKSPAGYVKPAAVGSEFAYCSVGGSSPVPSTRSAPAENVTTAWTDRPEIERLAVMRGSSPPSPSHCRRPASSRAPPWERSEGTRGREGARHYSLKRPLSPKRPFVVPTGGPGASSRLMDGASVSASKRSSHVGLGSTASQRALARTYRGGRLPSSRNFNLVDKLAAVGLSQYCRRMQVKLIRFRFSIRQRRLTAL